MSAIDLIPANLFTAESVPLLVDLQMAHDTWMPHELLATLGVLYGGYRHRTWPDLHDEPCNLHSGRPQPERRDRLGDLADVGLQVLDLGVVENQGFSEIENIESSRWSEFDAGSIAHAAGGGGGGQGRVGKIVTRLCTDGTPNACCPAPTKAQPIG